jgi:hypothetical protein
LPIKVDNSYKKKKKKKEGGSFDVVLAKSREKHQKSQ